MAPTLLDRTPMKGATSAAAAELSRGTAIEPATSVTAPLTANSHAVFTSIPSRKKPREYSGTPQRVTPSEKSTNADSCPSLCEVARVRV